MLSNWNQTFENIIKDPRNDKFHLIVNNKNYEVSLSYALGISPFITQQYLKNPTFNQFEIKIETKNYIKKKELEDEFSKFIKGEKYQRSSFLKLEFNLRM